MRLGNWLVLGHQAAATAVLVVVAISATWYGAPACGPRPVSASFFTAVMKPETHVMLTARHRTAIVIAGPLAPSICALTMMPAHTSPRGIIPIARAILVRWLASSR